MQSDHVSNKELKPEAGRSGQFQNEQPYRLLEARRAGATHEQRHAQRFADVLTLQVTDPLEPHAGAGTNQTGQSRCRGHRHAMLLLKETLD